MADEIINSAADDAGDPSSAESRSAEPAPQTTDESTPKQGWSRRAFFQAAALGAAATAFLDGKRFVPSIAWADDLSGSPCTANDVTVGIGTVTNPCASCDGNTFHALVTFPVTNNTGAPRYCVALHLPNGSNPIILGNVPANSTVTFGPIPLDIPCGQGLACIGGTVGAVTRGKCAPGTCATVAWNTSANSPCADPSPPGGQCRHQAVCVQNFAATLTCTDNCTVPCGGGASTLRACVTGVAPVTSGTPFTYTLKTVGGATVATYGPTADTCHDFTVSPTVTTGYQVTIADSRLGCSRTSPGQATVTVTNLTVSLAVESGLPPSGQACDTGTGVAFKATSSTCSGGATFTWKVDGVEQTVGVNGDTFTYPDNADGDCHTVSVAAVCGNCTSDPATRVIRQCIHSEVGAAGSSCPP